MVNIDFHDWYCFAEKVMIFIIAEGNNFAAM